MEKNNSNKTITYHKQIISKCKFVLVASFKGIFIASGLSTYIGENYEDYNVNLDAQKKVIDDFIGASGVVILNQEKWKEIMKLIYDNGGTLAIISGPPYPEAIQYVLEKYYPEYYKEIAIYANEQNTGVDRRGVLKRICQDGEIPNGKQAGERGRVILYDKSTIEVNSSVVYRLSGNDASEHSGYMIKEAVKDGKDKNAIDQDVTVNTASNMSGSGYQFIQAIPNDSTDNNFNTLGSAMQIIVQNIANEKKASNPSSSLDGASNDSNKSEENTRL